MNERRLPPPPTPPAPPLPPPPRAATHLEETGLVRQPKPLKISLIPNQTSNRPPNQNAIPPSPPSPPLPRTVTCLEKTLGMNEA